MSDKDMGFGVLRARQGEREREREWDFGESGNFEK